jgi:broad specificity phosphatase PhoE
VNRVVAWLVEVQGIVVAVSHGLVGRLIRRAHLGLPRREACHCRCRKISSGGLQMVVSKP